MLSYDIAERVAERAVFVTRHEVVKAAVELWATDYDCDVRGAMCHLRNGTFDEVHTWAWYNYFEQLAIKHGVDYAVAAVTPSEKVYVKPNIELLKGRFYGTL